MEFINTGLDERILKSLDVEHPSEELVKAMNKQGLVQKEVTVQGKNGTFTRKQWVKASEAGKSESSKASSGTKPSSSDSKGFDPFQVGGNNVTHYVDRKKFPPAGGVSSAYLAGKILLRFYQVNLRNLFQRLLKLRQSVLQKKQSVLIRKG